MKVYQHRRVGITLEFSTGELLARAAFMYHDDKGHGPLNHCAVLRVLRISAYDIATGTCVR